MKKVLTALLVFTMLFSFTACGGNKNTDGNNEGTQSLSVCLASEPDTIDPALNSTVDGATLVTHLFSGLAKWSQADDGSLVIVADCAEELTEGVKNEDGTVTYTYTLKDGLTWSDGQPLTAHDFVFSWNRAASPELSGGYHYMFDIVKGYSEMWETKDVTDENGNTVQEPANPDAVLSVEAKDEKTIVVTLSNNVNYWNELLAFPNFYPVREDVVSNEDWATAPETYIGNGPYSLTSWDHDSLITLTKNEKYHASESVTMPQLNFYLSNDQNNMLTNYKNGDWLLIDEVPTNEVEALKTEYADELIVEGQLGTYYASWNINQNILPESSTLEGEEAQRAMAEIRQAMGLLIDRNYIVNKISHGGEIPASTFVGMGLTEADGKTPFYQVSGNADDDFHGYFDPSEKAMEGNYRKAIEILKKYYTFDEATQKFTNVPALTYIYDTKDLHKAIAEYVQGAFGAVGITVNLENQEWNTFLNTRKQGDYTLARNGWLADYNDPISFLDMWTSDSGNNDVQLGKGEHRNIAVYDLDLTEFDIDLKIEKGTWADTYDALIREIKKCADAETRYKLMHLAEDMLMSTGCIMPIYYYADIYMLDDSVKGFYCNPLGYKYFMYTTIEE